MNKKLEFTIAGDLPSSNVFERGKNWKTRYGKQKELKEQWGWAIIEGLQRAKFNYIGNTAYFIEKVKVDLLLTVSSGRKKDRANIIHTCDKLIIDFLVKKRILIDDNPNRLEWGQIEYETGYPPAVRITLTPKED